MQFLCLDGGSEICSVCISRDEVVLAERNSTGIENHASITTVYIQQCLTETGLTIRELDAVVIASGPGSYTGLRVSASVAKGICMASGLPLIAIDSLTALAWGCHASESEGWIIPLIDARRMDVYAAVFDPAMNAMEPTGFMTLNADSFSQYGDRMVNFCGNGILKYKNVHNLPKARFLHDQARASFLFKPARARFLEENFENIASFAPNYLHSPNITVSKKNQG